MTWPSCISVRVGRREKLCRILYLRCLSPDFVFIGKAAKKILHYLPSCHFKPIIFSGEQKDCYAAIDMHGGVNNFDLNFGLVLTQSYHMATKDYEYSAIAVWLHKINYMEVGLYGFHKSKEMQIKSWFMQCKNERRRSVEPKKKS